MGDEAEVDGELWVGGASESFLRWDDAASHDSPNSFWVQIEVTW